MSEDNTVDRGRGTLWSRRSLYRDFTDRAKEKAKAAGVVDFEIDPVPRANSADFALPYVTTREGAQAVAVAFHEVYVASNPYRRHVEAGADRVGQDLTASCTALLSEYMPRAERTFGSLRDLADMERFDLARSPLDRLFWQVRFGVRCVSAEVASGQEHNAVLGTCDAERALGRRLSAGEVCMWSEFCRASDGKKPAENVHEDGTHGFTPQEDVSVALYQSYRQAPAGLRLAAIEELKDAIEFAACPRETLAPDVPYSLLDSLEASACRALIGGNVSDEILIRDCHRHLERCMTALRGEYQVNGGGR